MDKLNVVKIGGQVLDHSASLHAFLKSFSALPGPKILVHGGGKTANTVLDEMGMEPEMVDGRRVTNIETLRVITMVYAGLINKNVVAQLQRYGCNAIGLTGADANAIFTTQRPAAPINYGYVGDFQKASVNVPFIKLLLNANLVPTFSAITHDKQGQLLNTNADSIALGIAVALANKYAVSLFYCFEKKGVLRDIYDEQSIIKELRSSEFSLLKEQEIVSGGMLPKLEQAFNAIQQGIQEVYIGQAEELLSPKNEDRRGTRIVK